LISKGAKNVVITLGEKGAVWLAGGNTFSRARQPLVHSFSGLDKAVHIPGRVVKAVDTSGAGDAFIGALAYFLALGSDVSLCLEKANFVASESVQKHGTQTSFPKRSDLPPSFFDLTK
jgi:ribokinase